VEPAEAIKHMIDRQSDKVKERATRVASYSLRVLALGRSLPNQQDKLAVNWLCQEGFDLWCKTSCWTEYVVSKSTTNTDLMQVSFPGMDKAPYLIHVTCIEGITAISECGRCTCQDRTAYLHQCKHERAVLNGKFVSQLWQKRWKLRCTILMSNGHPAVVNDGGECSEDSPSGIGGSEIIMATEDVNGTIRAIGLPKEPEEEGDMFPDGDDDITAFLDGTVEVMPQPIVGATGLLKKVLVNGKHSQKLPFRNRMEIMGDLAKAYEGHPDEMEFYGAMIAQTRKLKGAGDEAISSSEYLSNYLSGFTSCRSKDVLFSQMEFSQTETNDTAPTSFPLATGLIPYGSIHTSFTGAPQRKRLKSHREKGYLTNSKKQKQSCGFCLLPGHTSKQCEALKKFAGDAMEILVDDKKEFAWQLVSPAIPFQVEQNPDEMDWQIGGLPLDTHHVVVLAMLVGFTFNSEVGGSTGLLVSLLSNNGQSCNGHIGPTVYRARAVSEWIMNKGAAKTKRLFSSLKPCSQVPQRDAMMVAI
jgi:hypothetical protein